MTKNEFVNDVSERYKQLTIASQFSSLKYISIVKF